MKIKNRMILSRILATLTLVSAFFVGGTASAAMPTIYHLDLNYAFGLPPGESYDLQHVAVCLQGLANREQSRAFVSFTPDDFVWLERLREPGGLCDGWNVQNVSFDEYLAVFMKYAQGVVLYDPDPATGAISSSLVATTVAGVENAIAIRKDLSAGSMYNYLVNDSDGPQLPVLVDLAGKFTGSGTIWDTSTPSTGSAKCDAYLWALEKYVDTGKCNTTELTYSLDLWGLGLGAGLDSKLRILDYAISKKSFCFELSPWDYEIPNDDPTQPMGTDYATYIEILDRYNIQNGTNAMIHICGFPNWGVKYTTLVGGSHGAVATEWEFVELHSKYNGYTDVEAGTSSTSFYSSLAPEVEQRRYVQNPAPTYDEMVADGLIDGAGNVPNGNYICLGMGDYDSPTWIMHRLSKEAGLFEEQARGQVNCNWGINPNLIDKVSVALDYVYRHKTEKDYFAAWDSGVGYLNPRYLYQFRAPGYPSIVPVWQDLCRTYYRQMDYSISGWVLGGSVGVDQTAAALYKAFSGDGIGVYQGQGSSVATLSDNVPGRVHSGGSSEAQNSLKNQLGVNFALYRVVTWDTGSGEAEWGPDYVKQLEDQYQASTRNHRFLDFYSFFYLWRYRNGGNNNYRATWVSDTIPRIMAAGQVYPVTVTVRNDGWDTWSEASSYRLAHAVLPEGSPVATSSDYDQTPRIPLPLVTTVLPSESTTFSFNITAPSGNGTYDLYYDMIRDGVTWFHTTNNIEWKKTIIIATNETDIDTDGDGVSDVAEELAGSVFWHPDDVVPQVAVILGDLVQTYDGLAKTASSSTIPSGLAVDLTYEGGATPPSAAGYYTVIGIINDPTYQGRVTNTFLIEPSATYNAWAAEWFTEGEQSNPAISGPDAYYDGDGYSNWEEYISGTDPTDAQAYPYLHMEMEAIVPGGHNYILNWTAIEGRVYSANWTPDLLQPFVPLQTNIEWPQSSYTDETHQVETKGFYRVNISREATPITTTATIGASGNLNGSSLDEFEGATITANSALHSASISAGMDGSDWFTSPNTVGDTLFADGAGMRFVDFNIAEAVDLASLVVSLASSDADNRSISNIKLYAGATPELMMETLVADVAVNPAYEAAYGSIFANVNIALESVEGPFFRIEFEQPVGGARVSEIDGFARGTNSVVTTATYSSAVHGDSGDLFQNATVTGGTASHPAGFLKEDAFTSGSPLFDETCIFADVTGQTVHAAEFNIASMMALGNVRITLANDGGANQSRTSKGIRLYASATAGIVPADLIADIALNPDFAAEYGANTVEFSIDFDGTSYQYFRVEVDAFDPNVGSRLVEVDGYAVP